MYAFVYGAVVWGLIGTFFATLAFLIFAPSTYDAYTSELPGSQDRFKSKATTSVQILVLGDIGRSPRMQNHAISLAKHGARVDLIGFVESDIHNELKKSEMVNVIALPRTPEVLQTNHKIAFTLLAPLKVIWQIFSLFSILCYSSRASRWMLVQNPPSIPTLAVATMVCFIRNTTLVIDWHNTGWSILALKLGSNHPLVHLAELYERLFSKGTYHHFAVSKAMSSWLKTDLAVNAVALHDRPTSDFNPLSTDERFKVLKRIPETAPHWENIKSGATKLLISSTSWTKDEDFSMLLDALVGYSAHIDMDSSMPHLLAIITGRGSGKQYYLERIEKLNETGKLSHATIITGWFSLEDYTSLLGAADLGVCLHKSSSGLDLPMKVVDMFGAGLPVLGYSDYPSWTELVREGVNGRGFTTTDELENLLIMLFSEYGTLLEILRDGALKERENNWDKEWNTHAGKALFLPQAANHKS